MTFLSRERIRTELDGILEGDYLADLILPMLKSHIFKPYHDVEEGFKILCDHYKKVDTIRFMALASLLKGSVSNDILLSKKEIDAVKKIMKFSELIKQRQLSPLSLFEENPKYVYDAYEVLEIIDVTPYKKSDLDEIISSLKFKTRKEINIDGNDILALMPKTPTEVGKYLDFAYVEVIMERVPNEKEAILEHVKEQIKINQEYQKRTNKK